MPDPDPGSWADADSILGSLSVMVARSSVEGTLPDEFLTEMSVADPTGARLCQLLDRASAAGARFGAGFLRAAGRVLLAPGAPPPYDGLRAWLRAVNQDAALVLDVLEDRELAGWLLSTQLSRSAAGRLRSQLLSRASEGEGPDRQRSVALARWAHELCTGAAASSLTAPFEGLAVLLSSDVVVLDDLASDEQHPARAAMRESLTRMRGDQLALSALADRCTRFNRLRILGEPPHERRAAVEASCRLLDFTLRPLLGDTRQGDMGEDYLRVARELTAMTALWALLRDARELCPVDLVASWPGAGDDGPARIAELEPVQFRDLLDLAGAAEGLVGGVVAAAGAPAPAP